mgnify:CR=1 FL=1
MMMMMMMIISARDGCSYDDLIQQRAYPTIIGWDAWFGNVSY